MGRSDTVNTNLKLFSFRIRQSTHAHAVWALPALSLQAAVYSRKLSWGWLRVQFVAGFNWAKRRPTLDYRCGGVAESVGGDWGREPGGGNI